MYLVTEHILDFFINAFLFVIILTFKVEVFHEDSISALLSFFEFLVLIV